MADSYLYAETIDAKIKEDPMQKKEMLYVLDQNGGSYNGQIQLDTSTLANSGKFLAYSEAYLEIPLQITAKSTVDITAAVNGFILGLKNGYHQLIDSIQVDYNNSNVVQQQPFTNFFVTYKLMSTFSRDDLVKYGPSIGFWPDNAASMSYASAANINGDGTSNNLVNPAGSITYASQLESSNAGFLKRLQSTSYPISGYGGITQINTSALANQIGKNYLNSSGVGAATVYQWSILATIRLKDLADFFDKMPLVKGAFMRMTINYNSANMTMTSTSSPITMVTSSLTMRSGRTNPILLSSGAALNPLATLPAGVLTIGCGIGASTLNSIGTSQISSVRLYVPAYKLNPQYEEQLYSLAPVREISYTDLYNYNVVSIAPGGQFNAILTNGIVDPRYLVVLPFLSGSNSGVAGNFPPYQSMFDSAPGTTSPLCALSNFNVQVGGENLFQQNFQYDFEAFLNETSRLGAIAGGCSTGLTNGLLGSLEFDNGYRYYVADLSRGLPSEDSIPKSITIQGTNNTSKIIDLITFTVSGRKIRLDSLTGAILK